MKKIEREDVTFSDIIATFVKTRFFYWKFSSTMEVILGLIETFFC